MHFKTGEVMRSLLEDIYRDILRLRFLFIFGGVSLLRSILLVTFLSFAYLPIEVVIELSMRHGEVMRTIYIALAVTVPVLCTMVYADRISPLIDRHLSNYDPDNWDFVD